MLRSLEVLLSELAPPEASPADCPDESPDDPPGEPLPEPAAVVLEPPPAGDTVEVGVVVPVARIVVAIGPGLPGPRRFPEVS